MNLSVFGQPKQLPKEVRLDFCKNSIYNFKYGSDAFKSMMISTARDIGLYSIVEIEIGVENLCSNKKLQDQFFQNVLRIGGSKDFVFYQFKSIGMTASNAKIISNFLIQNRDYKIKQERLKASTSNNEKEINTKQITYDEITGYPNQIYNPKPLNDNPSIGFIKWDLKEIEKLLTSKGEIKFPILVSKLQSELKVKPLIEIDNEFPESKEYTWTLYNGITINAINIKGNISCALKIYSNNSNKIRGLPFGLILNESSIKDVENQLLKIRTQKLGNYIEFKKGNMNYRFEFNSNKTLGTIHVF